jgi:hypothetical protein
MVNEEEIRRRIEKFKEILDFYGVKKELISYVPPSFAVRWGELSQVMADYGFKYSSTIFRTMVCDGEKPVTAGVENGIVTVDRVNNLIPWNEHESEFDNLPLVNGVFGAHLPNFLHLDVSRSAEVVERAVKYFKRCAEQYGTVMSRGIEFCAVQSVYNRFAKADVRNGEITFDLSEVEKTPVFGKPFVISTLYRIESLTGAEIIDTSTVGGFYNYELSPKSTVLNVKFC